MYTTGIEAILGFKLFGNKLKIEPQIDPTWATYKIYYRHFETTYEIEIKNPKGLSSGINNIYQEDGINVEGKNYIELVNDKVHHKIEVELS
jgi:cellobiose phosphorylase